MRVRLRRAKAYNIGVECSKCRVARFYKSWEELEHCPCGGVTGIIFSGRYEWKNTPEADARVEAYRAWARQVEASRRRVGRRVKLVFRKKERMAKFKIVKRNPVESTAKAAQPGSARTGAKVEKVKSGKGNRGGAAGRFLGKTTGLSIAKFQNKTIEENRKKKLSDMALVRLWKAEFPNAKSDYTPAIVRGVRGLVNKGKHGNNDGRPLANPIPEYDEQGNALPFVGPGSRRSLNRSTSSGAQSAKGKAAPAKKLKKVAK